MNYVELNCKSNFSFLRGASDSRDYIRRAAELQMSAVGVCDVNGVYALPRAFETIRDEAPQIKLIAGAEITVTDHPTITLIAQTRIGYGLLCRILTQLHASKEKGQGCLALSELVSLLENFPGGTDLTCIAKIADNTNFSLLKELFPRNTYLPLCRYLDGLDLERTQHARELSEKFNLPIVAHNDVHYHISTRRPLQDCLTCIREGTTIDKAGFLLFGNEERYLKSPLQMQSLFYDMPEAIRATAEIAEKCTFSLSELKYTYPHEFIPPGHTARSYLREVVLKGAHETYKGLIPEKVDAQIRRELDFFAKRGDEHYFLTVYDIVNFARQQNILCQGRGSAANSIVCYVLGITSVDPVQMNLLFDRFMNEGRKEPPDIDIDFEHHRREEVIQYIYNRFGRDRAAMVSAVRTYRKKSSFLELSKALGINVGTMSASELEKRFDELAGEKIYRKSFVEELATQLSTFPRHLSIHSGGFVLSNDPLIEMVPVEPARMPGRTIVQWDKEDLETLGLMKVDVLSIGFLTVLHKATDLAGLNWRDIPDDDPKTYRMIQRAETHGTFQIESRAQMNMLVQTLPRNYYDLVIEVALVRPSPTVGGMVQPFMKGLRDSRQGRPFRIGNPILERILRRTHGIPIFQEQIMEISIAIAGFTPAEADQLRRSLVRQRSAAALDEMGKKLYDALVSAGIPQKFADSLFLYIQGYAHYGFPESHAASYASLAYKSAYMKCHHPAELLIGLINSQPMGFYTVDNLLHEAVRNSGVQIRPIDPHISIWDATLDAPKTVRMGFRNIKAIREHDVQAMLAERTRESFHSIEDFIFRTNFSKNVIENLAMSGVFEAFGLDRRHTFWKSLEFSTLCDRETNTESQNVSQGESEIQSETHDNPRSSNNSQNQNQTRSSNKTRDNRRPKQLSFFNSNMKLESSTELFAPMKLLEKVTMDHRMTGYSLEGSLMKAIRLELPHLPALNSVQIKNLQQGQLVRYAGIVSVLQKPPPAKGTAFITFEDETGTVDSVVRPEIYEKYRPIIRSSRFLIVSGKIQRKGTGVSILISQIESFAPQESKYTTQPGAHPRSLGRLDFKL